MYFILAFISYPCLVPNGHDATQKLPKDPYFKPPNSLLFPWSILGFQIAIFFPLSHLTIEAPRLP